VIRSNLGEGRSELGNDVELVAKITAVQKEHSFVAALDRRGIDSGSTEIDRINDRDKSFAGRKPFVAVNFIPRSIANELYAFTQQHLNSLCRLQPSNWSCWLPRTGYSGRVLRTASFPPAPPDDLATLSRGDQQGLVEQERRIVQVTHELLQFFPRFTFSSRLCQT
jgi:hypothetical protein